MGWRSGGGLLILMFLGVWLLYVFPSFSVILFYLHQVSFPSSRVRPFTNLYSSPQTFLVLFQKKMYTGLTQLIQVQAALPSLRKTRGRIIFTSSGAAQSAYQGWGAYGAGKAVLNHLAATLGVEEPDVCIIYLSNLHFTCPPCPLCRTATHCSATIYYAITP